MLHGMMSGAAPQLVTGVDDEAGKAGQVNTLPPQSEMISLS